MQISKATLQTSVRVFGISFTSITDTQGVSLNTEIVDGVLFLAVIDQRKGSSSFGQKALIPVSSCSLLVPVVETVPVVEKPVTGGKKKFGSEGDKK